jgi:uncharacterized protein with ParB-like and HNH nuclease domain
MKEYDVNPTSTVGDDVELLESEEQDRDYSPPSYDIVAYPADYTLEGLVAKLQRGTIQPAGFQRRYVWKLPQASKLIESFLLGLPVPAVFLYTKPEDNSLLVIDGQQRLMSIRYFFEGYFGLPDESGKSTVFSLKGLSETSPYYDKTYNYLREHNETAFNKLNEAVLRAFIVKQLKPEDDTSIYHIFQRLNTGGTPLAGQEIRNCIYHGPLNDRLGELNQFAPWRRVFGKNREDSRQRDVELILRFLALFYNLNEYEKPMTDFLSRFMRKHQNASRQSLDNMSEVFKNTTTAVLELLGDRPFHIRAGINAAVFDSVYVAVARHMIEAHQGSLRSRYDQLLKNDEFAKCVSSNTTDTEIVRKRVATVEEVVQATE